MTDRLLLVRHTAATLSEHLPPGDWPPSDEGIAAAARLATAGIFDDVRTIASSPERKSLATSEPLAERLGLELLVEPDLREVDRPPGPIVSPEEVMRRVRRYFDGGLEGWEPADAARRRATRCIERITQTTPGPHVVVSHGLLLTLYRNDTGPWQGMPLPAVAIAGDADFGPWLSVEETLAVT